jgi:hypothetical protein
MEDLAWPLQYTAAMQKFVPTCMVVATGLLVACGSVGKVPAADGNTDTGGPQGPVTVTVLSAAGDGVPDSTAKVVFQDPDGAVVSDTGVDAMGHAQAMMPRGGTVSAIRITMDTPANLTASITSTLGVKPGDNLTFGLKANATILNQGGSTTMTATMFQPVSGATNYKFYTPCGVNNAPAAPATLNFRDSCHGAMFDLLGVTSVGSPPTLMFLLLTGVTYVSGGSFNISTLWNSMADFTVNMTNVPDAVSQISVSRATLLNNTPTFSLSTTVQGDPPAGNVSAMVPFPQGVGTRNELSITMARPDAINQQHDVHTASLGTSATVDLSKQQLPWFTNLAQTAMGATWTMVAPGDPPDGMIVNWSGSWNDGTRPVAISWSVAQDATMTGMTLPKLPAAYAMVDPGQQTVAVKQDSVALYMADYDNLAGYDQLRQMPETLLTTPIGVMGAFVGMPFQRRFITKTVVTP